jgi:hypothetical protein
MVAQPIGTATELRYRHVASSRRSSRAGTSSLAGSSRFARIRVVATLCRSRMGRLGEARLSARPPARPPARPLPERVPTARKRAKLPAASIGRGPTLAARGPQEWAPENEPGPHESDVVPLAKTSDVRGNASFNINPMLLDAIRLSDRFWEQLPPLTTCAPRRAHARKRRSWASAAQRAPRLTPGLSRWSTPSSTRSST